jgi:uncharacterized protein (DUF1800 family)
MSFEGAIAVHRFGLGARAGEIEAASGDPKRWLMAQLEGPADQPQPLDGQTLMTGGQLVAGLQQLNKQRKELRMAAGQDAGDQLKALNKARYQIVVDEMMARFAHGFTTDKPFAERLVWFWSNHFVVSTANGQAATFVGAFEREAIRPYINASFEEMAQAAVHHPAMLLYLNNAQSIGPHSPAGLRTGKGLNENLGRELMELYTLGVDGGYTQADVIAMAKLLTGWSLAVNGRGDRNGFRDGNGFQFYPFRHEPGDVTLRGKSYPGSYEGCVAAIDDLARDPATAHHIATKFAAVFIADNPPVESVARLEKTFKQTKGNLRALAEAAIRDPVAWSGRGKMRTPVEYVTATYRLLGLPKAGPNPDAIKNQIRGAMGTARMMGEFPLSPPSPKGWPLSSEAWSGPDAVLDRVEWARQVGQRMPASFDALALADERMGPLLSPETKAAMRTANTPGEAVALLIASPEFQRR